MLECRKENEEGQPSQATNSIDEEIPRPSTSSNYPQFYSSIFSTNEESSEDNELDRYFNAEFFDVGDNINEFWRNNESRFPTISKVARKILSIPPSTAECERSFSRL